MVTRTIYCVKYHKGILYVVFHMGYRNMAIYQEWGKMHAKKRAEEEVIEALSDDKTIRLQTPTVISTVGSGVGKSTCSTLRSIGAGDFSTQSFNRVYILLTPYRHAAPLEMTVTASRSPVISTAAKRSGEISLLYAAWLWCLSRLPAHR